MYIYDTVVSIEGSDFPATARRVSLTPENVRACADFPVYIDSVALERPEAFQVGLQIAGTSSPSDRRLINGGRTVLVPGTATAQVTINDDSGGCGYANYKDVRVC